MSRFSIVIPVYRNSGNIQDLLNALSGVRPEIRSELSVVFVIDGSPDDSEQQLRWRLPDCPFASTIIRHSRNFGSFAAIRTGLEHTTGDCIGVMAADLQEPIEWVEEVLLLLADDKADVCVGVRASRHDDTGSQLLSQLYWWFYRRFVMPEIPPGGVDVFAITQRVAKVLTTLPETNSSLVGQLMWVGFRRLQVPYHRQRRTAGKSAWTFKAKLRYLMNSFFAFTSIPITLMMSIGAAGMGISGLYGLVVLVSRLTGQIHEAGFAAIITTILLTTCINLLCLGILGQYLFRTYENTRGRPLSIVSEMTSFASLHSGNRYEG
jgi:glycosyltransferase involved in cell wall biosynthesis